MITDKYTCHYVDSVYYPCWSKAIDYVSGRVLELGCGTGQFADMLKENKKCEYIGIDLNEEWINFAKENYDMDFRVMDIFQVDWQKTKVNTVVAFQVFEHLAKDRELIKRIPRGTKIIFSVPNFWSKDHVRVYPDKRSIKDRYSTLMKIRSIDRFVTLKREMPLISNLIFLCYGIKR